VGKTQISEDGRVDRPPFSPPQAEPEVEESALLGAVRRNRARLHSLYRRLQQSRTKWAALSARLSDLCGARGGAHNPQSPLRSPLPAAPGSVETPPGPIAPPAHDGADTRRTIGLVAVTFRYPASLARGVRTVSVVGSFNGWNHTAHPMRQTPSRDWTLTVYLSPGRIVYLFSADGVLRLDPAGEERIRNGWGSQYSVRHVVRDGEEKRHDWGHAASGAGRRGSAHRTKPGLTDGSAA
jgi:Glycogen recognition site of AMP-activated protein kinase